MINIGIGIGWAKAIYSVANNVIANFKARVLSYPNSIFEAGPCLDATLEGLNAKGLLDNASLIITPNAYNTGILYDVVPNTTLGDMDVVRATTATRVNSAGLIEVVPRNLLTYSEQFENTNWTKLNTTITPNSINSPIGTLTADSLVGNTTNARHNILQSLSGASDGSYSLYVKANQLRYLQFASANTAGQFANFDILTGTIGTVGGDFSNAQITLITNGWYRISVTSVSRYNNFYISLVSSLTAGWLESWAMLNNTDSLYIWGAQLENFPTATEYFPTTTRLNIPRIDYTNGSCPSLLVEPQRTNLISNANGYAGNFVYYTVTPNQSSPDGLNNAVLFVEKTSTSAYSINSINASILPNTQYTYSFFVKYAGIQFIPINATDGVSGFVATFDALNGIITSGIASVQQYTDDWYRVSLTRTSGATANTATIQHGFGTKTGDGVSGFYLFGNQIEQGSNPTSYIPTVASTVTRNADVISKTGISSLIGQTEGTVFFDLNTIKFKPDFNSIMFSDGTDGFRFGITSDSNFTQLQCIYVSTQTFSSNVLALPIATKVKIAIKYSIGELKFFANGVLISSFSPANDFSVNNLSQFRTGRPAGGREFFGEISSILLWKTKLTDAECIKLTTL